MPLYEYECEACGRRFELIRKFSDPPLESCTACGKGPVRRLQSSPAFQFKGSGWYVTDYAGKGKAEAAAAEKPADPATSGDTTAKPASDAAPAAKTDAAAKSTPPSTTTSESKP